MKKILVLLWCVCIYGVLFSQTTDSKRSLFQFSFFPPLSTNGIHSSQYTNKFSFNVLAGISESEEGFTFGGLSNVILKDAKGIQFAGLSNHVGNEGSGFQFAGLANMNKNGFSGFQFAGLLNTASTMNGFQFSGLANLAKETDGFQFAGLTNIAEEVGGFQFSGLMNIAEEVDGFQFAGLINVAKSVKGVQFAGLINIAEDSDCPIGLVNIIKNGEKSIAVTYDALGSTVASFRSGGKYTYGILGVGYNHKTRGSTLVTEGGLGAHIPVLPWFRINNEVKFSSIGSNSQEPVINAGYSLLPAFRIGQHIELFAGAGVHYMETKNMNNHKIFPDHSLWKKHGPAKWQQLYIGYQFGCQYIF